MNSHALFLIYPLLFSGFQPLFSKYFRDLTVFQAQCEVLGIKCEYPKHRASSVVGNY